MEIELVQLKDSDYIPVGKPFDVEMKFSNKAEKKRKVDVTLSVSLVWYNGATADVVKKCAQRVTCEADEGKVHQQRVEIYIDVDTTAPPVRVFFYSCPS